jgi:hypothetical protein
MPLQEQLDAFKADFEGNKAPPEVVAINAQGYRRPHRLRSG